jgi:hypothetical protein
MKGRKMAESEKRVGQVLFDASVIIAAVTALAYFFGCSNINWFWQSIGLKGTIHPDATTQQVLLRGGPALVVAAFVYLFCLYHRDDNWAVRLRGTSDNRLQIVFVLIAVVIAFVLSIGFAKIRGHFAYDRLPRVQYINLEVNSVAIPSPEQLAFIGRHGPYMIFMRMEGTSKGQTVIVADSIVKSFALHE